jgi:hypothetical protein
MAAANVEAYKRRYDRLKADRGTWESHWEEIAEYELPSLMGFTGSRAVGEKRMQKIFDSTGVHSVELLAAGLHGLATNPASKWFSLRMADEDLNENESVKEYLSAVEKRMWSAVYAPGTNFTTALHECYMSMGAFGTAVMFIGQREDGGLHFHCRSLSECVLAENSEGVVDTLYRCFEYTVRQMLQLEKSDGWKVSDKVRALADGDKWDDNVKIIHVVGPRSDRDYAIKNPGPDEMPFASCYFEHDTGHKLEESGFPEFPFLAPRWSKSPGEIYGRSPGMTALPDIKMLQAMMLTIIKAAQKIADPPLFIPDDGVMGPVRTVPGGLNFYRGSREIFPLPTSNGLPLEFEMMESLRNRIRSTFYTDILQINTDTDMTATEVVQRTQERMRLLGPMVGRLEAELLGPLVARVFGILHREGKLPIPPEEIQDQDFTVEYVSPIATAQKQTEAHGMQMVWQMLVPFGPEIAAQIIQKNQNIDRTYAYLWDLFNNDPKLLKTEEERGQEGALDQAQQAAALAGPAADALQKTTGAVQNLANANAQEGTDLGAGVEAIRAHAERNPELVKQLRAAMASSGMGGAAQGAGMPQ